MLKCEVNILFIYFPITKKCENVQVMISLSKVARSEQLSLKKCAKH